MIKTDYTAILINSKTNGEHYTIVDKKALDHLQSFPGFRGFCIQSTNTKKEGRNPSLYPCIYGRDPRTLRYYVKQIHKVLIPIVPYGFVIDHKDGDTFNNRFSNLEIVTRAENTRRAQIGRYKDSG